MGFCKYGENKVIGTGQYYVCSVTNYPCKFARWCTSSLTYKPNANFRSCNIRIKQDREYLNALNKQKEEVVEVVPEIVEPQVVEDIFSDFEEATTIEEIVEPEENFVPKPSKRKRKASSR